MTATEIGAYGVVALFVLVALALWLLPKLFRFVRSLFLRLTGAGARPAQGARPDTIGR